MKLRLAAALSVLALSGCVVAPLPLHPHRVHGHHAAPPAYWGGGIYLYDYGPRHHRPHRHGPWRRW